MKPPDILITIQGRLSQALTTERLKCEEEFGLSIEVTGTGTMNATGLGDLRPNYIDRVFVRLRRWDPENNCFWMVEE